jgi:predicted MPP superfamily phosphohydrolase
MRVRNLPAALDGFTIAQTSDLHVGEGSWGPFCVDDVTGVLEAEQPDAVVDTGDFVVGSPPSDKVAEVYGRFVVDGNGLGRIELNGTINLTILGNHDYYAGTGAVAELAAALRGTGAKVLTNEVACVSRDGVAVSFVGLVPEAEGFDEAVRMLEDVPRPRVALLHDPDVAEQLPPGAADLVLAGHTHGGQIALPGLEGWAVRHFNGSHYVAGLYQINGNTVYVNRGLGCTGLPIRFRAAPELTIIYFAR